MAIKSLQKVDTVEEKNGRYYDKYQRNKESDKFYHSSAWLKVKEMVLIRDNYLCQSCLSKKKIQKAEVVHHIKELREFPELKLTLENLISWCNTCHTTHHNKKKKVPKGINVYVSKANEEMI